MNLEDLEKHFFAPLDIFWKQKNGKVILISKKGDVINFDLIKKLKKEMQEIFFQEQIMFDEVEELAEIYAKHAEELLVKNKIIWRKRFVGVFSKNFLKSSQDGRLKLNALALRIFWNGPQDELLIFENRDEGLFKRSLSVASDYSYCAFFLGYYDHKFLARIFAKTLRDLILLGESEGVISFKEKMEEMRAKESFCIEDSNYAKRLLGEESEGNIIFEKLNGKGLRELSPNEMDDLEIVFIALNSVYEFKNEVKDQKILEILSQETGKTNMAFKILRNILMPNNELNEAA